MTTLREAAQQALEALETLVPTKGPSVHNSARDALRAALAEPLINQCGETCERAKLCAVCASKLAEPVQPLTIERLRDALVASRRCTGGLHDTAL